MVETTGITNQKVFHMASISSEETNVPPFKYWKKPSRVVLILSMLDTLIGKFLKKKKA